MCQYNIQYTFKYYSIVIDCPYFSIVIYESLLDAPCKEMKLTVIKKII